MQNVKRYTVVWLPPLLLIIGYCCRGILVPIAQWAAEHIVMCVFHKTTGLYCLGCGGTRSIMALLHGNIPLAFRNNPLGPALVVLLLLWYIEKSAEALGKPVKLIPRKFAFWMVLLALVFIWNLIRNFVPAMMPVS